MILLVQHVDEHIIEARFHFFPMQSVPALVGIAQASDGLLQRGTFKPGETPHSGG